MKKVQVMISYCTADTAVMKELEKAFAPAIEDYKTRGVELYICQMEKDCAGDWGEWSAKAIKSSDVVVFVLSDNSMYSDAPKRILEELCIVHDNSNEIKLVPFKITAKPLSPAVEFEICRCSAVWTVTDDSAQGISEDSYEQVVRKARILLDSKLEGKTINQFNSLNIGTGVFVPYKHFVGRKEELAQLRDILTRGNVAIISGEGGLGKTELAKYFVAANTDVFERGYIVNADGGIRNGICRIDFETTREIKNEEERYRQNCALLKRLPEKTIIIFDNCDTDIKGEELAELTRKEMACRFLITSRPQSEQAECLRLGRMSDADLKELVYVTHPNIEKANGKTAEQIEEELIKLFDNVQGHTMTVEMAAAVMRDGDVSIEEINAGLLSCAERCKTARSTAAQTVSEHLGMLYDMATLTDAETLIMKAMCLISPDAGIQRKQLKAVLGLADNGDINALITKTFIKIDEDAQLRLHRLFSDVFYKKERSAIVFEEIKPVLDYVTDIETDKANLPTAEQVVALCEFLVTKRKDVFDKDAAGRGLLYRTLFSLNAGHQLLANYADSIRYGEQALSIALEHFGEESTKTANILNNLSISYTDLGDNKKALEYYLKALAIYEVVYKDYPNHPDLAMSYNNLGATYADLGDNEKALEYKLKAQAIYEVVYKDYPNHPDLAMSYYNLGATYADLGDNEKALEYYLKALAIREVVYKDYPNHPNLAMSYNNLGVTYADLGDNEKALEYKLKALAIREVVYKDYPNHPKLARSYNNLGVTYSKLGDNEKAKEYAEKAERIRKANGE